MTQADKVHKSIERLLRTSGNNDWNIVSVVCESNKYSYKTFGGKISTVSMDFIDQRVKDGQY